jgi:small GTP-binding protein
VQKTPKAKVVLFGDESVGKSCLLQRHLGGSFASGTPTVGADFATKDVCVSNSPLHLQLWDTAGAPRFHALMPSYADGATVALIVFDVTKRSSFENVGRWCEVFEDALDGPRHWFLVASKTDAQPDDWQVSSVEAEHLAQRLGAVALVVTSAATGDGVEELFVQVGSCALQALGSEDFARSCAQARTRWEEVPLDDESDASARFGPESLLYSRKLSDVSDDNESPFGRDRRPSLCKFVAAVVTGHVVPAWKCKGLLWC